MQPDEPDASERTMSEEEVARRRDEVVKRMLATLPKPKKGKPPKLSD